MGVPAHPTSWRDQLVSTITSGLGIAFVVIVASATRPDSSPQSLWLVGSIGASAVLVFAVPHGALSQPWAVLGGHGVSAVVGIIVAHVVGGGTAAKALAVGLAIGVMQVCRCLHPPGGATALAAILLVTPTSTPSWQYPLTPVMLDAALIVVAAVALNAPFRWRRYPLALAFPKPSPNEPAATPAFTQAQLGNALREMDTVVQISDEELEMLYRSLHDQQDATPETP